MAEEKLAKLKSTRVYGSLNVDSNTTLSGNVSIAGDLNVSGTINYVNTETILLSDNTIVLNSDYTGSTPSENASIEVKRGTLPNVAIRWNESIDAWELTNDGTNYLAIGSSYTGSHGYTGSQGYTGSASTEIGYTGSQGDIGYTGSRGEMGYAGSAGYTGSASTEVGYTGSLGYTGSQGDIGYTGSASTEIGYTGSQGDVGYTGSQGDTGYTGSQGDIGYTGSASTLEAQASDDTTTDAYLFPLLVSDTGSAQSIKASKDRFEFNPARGRLRVGNISLKSEFSANSSKTEFLANGWSYSGTTITVTKINHGLSSGDFIYVSGATSSTNPPNGGPFEITVNDSNEFEFTALFTPTGVAGGSFNVVSYEFLGVSSSAPAVVFEGKVRMVSDLELSPSMLVTQNGVDVLTAQYIYEKSPTGAHIITTSSKGAFKIKTGDGNTYEAFIMQDSSGGTTFSITGEGVLKASNINVTGPYLSLNTGSSGTPDSSLKGGIVFKRGSSTDSGVYWNEDVDRFSAVNADGEKLIAQDGDVYDGGTWS